MMMKSEIKPQRALLFSLQMFVRVMMYCTWLQIVCIIIIIIIINKLHFCPTLFQTTQTLLHNIQLIIQINWLTELV